MKFTIWYENNQYEGHSLDDWQSLPNNGVVAVLEYFDDSRYRISSGSDWYWILGDDVLQSGTTHNEPNKFVQNPQPTNPTIKSGKWVSDQRMNEVDNAIKEIING
jgi:hypothetical protein